ncbi:MAG: bifunctional phosphoribosylaminoimidazolecarboxamide formyltransferase/IMP cyclohydrolase, partial [Alphaproteobacteria bacterium]|nr:bifunctional phosphoribosylaminoimidazolecarboxamide formyltransferase/IMP cyclohydrolase [Alphaproteobacteria bacterium]
MNAKITRALLSVSDKTGLVDFARALQARGIEILSTGGTAAHLKENGIKLREVSDYTGFPEIMDGRVKTLQPKIHGGLLADRDNAAHRKAMDDHGIGPIDLLVVNLYPFQDTVNKGADRKTCIENIDIGGPAMIRAAAKNHAHVGVVIDPADYPTVLADLETHAGSLSETLKQSLASKAFALTAAYDSAIAGWLNNNNSLEIDFPQNFTLAGTLVQTLRYGENPHQKAALYLRPDDLRPGAARARQLQGKELSFNNINDTDAAFNLVCEFAQPACVIVKHANPCGVALDDNLASA